MTVLKMGWTNPQTDSFGAHPVLGPVLDLNDGVTFSLTTPDGFSLGMPTRTLAVAGNIRVQGERATRAVYQHNRRAVARVTLGPMATARDLAATLRTLLAWVNAPPAVPLTIQYQPFGSALPSYLDVVGVGHSIPVDESQWLRLQLEPIELVFLVRPGLRSDRVTAQNLATNPGFEWSSQSGVTAFFDTLANANAYSSLAGAAPSVASNLLTVPGSATVGFWLARVGRDQPVEVSLQVGDGQRRRLLPALHRRQQLPHRHGGWRQTVCLAKVAGVYHDVATPNAALTTGTFYWIQATQFPTTPLATGTVANPAYVTATIFNDSAGAVGASIAAAAGPTFDAVTALGGKMAIVNRTATALTLGGAFNNVQVVQLFGPGAWSFASSGTGLASGS